MLACNWSTLIDAVGGQLTAMADAQYRAAKRPYRTRNGLGN
jgi:hypothetical protein